MHYRTHVNILRKLREHLLGFPKHTVGFHVAKTERTCRDEYLIMQQKPNGSTNSLFQMVPGCINPENKLENQKNLPADLWNPL